MGHVATSHFYVGIEFNGTYFNKMFFVRYFFLFNFENFQNKQKLFNEVKWYFYKQENQNLFGEFWYFDLDVSKELIIELTFLKVLLFLTIFEHNIFKQTIFIQTNFKQIIFK